MLVPDFVPGDATWSLYIDNLTLDPSDLYAYCAQNITFSSVEPQTILCNIRLDESASGGGDQTLGEVFVLVQLNGYPVPGAEVYANGEIIGITGTGNNGTTAGGLTTFLPEGQYSFSVRSPNGDETIEIPQVAVIAGSPHRSWRSCRWPPAPDSAAA